VSIAAEAACRRHAAALEHELGRVRRAQPEFVLDLGDEEPGRALLQQECGDAVVGLGGIRLGED
jgi:hypothetical protein